MLNNEFSTPLHGVELASSASNKDGFKHGKLPYSLQLVYKELSIPPNTPQVWSLTDSGERYNTQLTLYKISNNEYILDVACEGSGKFYISPTEIAIDWQANGTSASHYFQTLAMSLWLELHNVICIHANALVINEKSSECFALLAPSGMGKSTLSAYLQQHGCKWLNDDMMAIHCVENANGELEYRIYPSWPNARMWPDSLEALTQANIAELDRVHSKFNKRQVPISALEPTKSYQLNGIYILERLGAKLTVLERNAKLKAQQKAKLKVNNKTKINGANIELVNSSAALIALLQNSMLGSAYSGLGLEAVRLEALSKVINKIPTKLISYANDYDILAQVHHIIALDQN